MTTVTAINNEDTLSTIINDMTTVTASNNEDTLSIIIKSQQNTGIPEQGTALYCGCPMVLLQRSSSQRCKNTND
jgi:hypothetical protein